MSAQERYDELKAGEDAMDAVDRLRFFCSLAMNGQDWIDVEPYFDGVTAELEALRADAERYRWLKANHLQTGADSWIRTGEDLEEAIDAARAGGGQ